MRILYVLAILAVSGCAVPVAVDAGCEAYAESRASIPPLGRDAVSGWVAANDVRMTVACN